jgi:hypothetical protein
MAKESHSCLVLKEANPKIIQHLAEHRQSVGTATTVDFLHEKFMEQGLHIRRSEVIDVLKACADEGVGTFYTGRHGKKSRIVWRKDRSEFAKDILRQRGQPSGETTEEPAPDATAQTEEENSSIPMMRYPFILRTKLEISVELPKDLTVQEANRLSDFIKTLPLA